jgi:hypothetical protein
MLRAVCLLVLVSCGAPKQPAATDDLDLPRRSVPVEVPVDAAVIDAAVPDAKVPDARAVTSDEAACENDPAAKQACESMGARFAPRLVLPCHRGEGAPVKPVPRCMCVDPSKPRECK